MKQQNNSRKLTKAVWHRDSEKINNFCALLNHQINEFNKKNGVVLSVSSDINRTMFFDKVFFEDNQQLTAPVGLQANK